MDGSIIALVFRVANFGIEMSEVNADSRVFFRMIHRVQTDLDKSFNLLHTPAVDQRLKVDPTEKSYIEGAIESVRAAIAGIGQFVESVRHDHDMNGSISIANRVNWILKHQSKLTSRSYELSTAHQTLLHANARMGTWCDNNPVLPAYTDNTMVKETEAQMQDTNDVEETMKLLAKRKEMRKASNKSGGSAGDISKFTPSLSASNLSATVASENSTRQPPFLTPENKAETLQDERLLSTPVGYHAKLIPPTSPQPSSNVSPHGQTIQPAVVLEQIVISTMTSSPTGLASGSPKNNSIPAAKDIPPPVPPKDEPKHDSVDFLVNPGAFPGFPVLHPHSEGRPAVTSMTSDPSMASTAENARTSRPYTYSSMSYPAGIAVQNEQPATQPFVHRASIHTQASFTSLNSAIHSSPPMSETLPQPPSPQTKSKSSRCQSADYGAEHAPSINPETARSATSRPSAAGVISSVESPDFGISQLSLHGRDRSFSQASSMVSSFSTNSSYRPPISSNIPTTPIPDPSPYIAELAPSPVPRKPIQPQIKWEPWMSLPIPVEEPQLGPDLAPYARPGYMEPDPPSKAPYAYAQLLPEVVPQPVSSTVGAHPFAQNSKVPDRENFPEVLQQQSHGSFGAASPEVTSLAPTRDNYPEVADPAGHAPKSTASASVPPAPHRQTYSYPPPQPQQPSQYNPAHHPSFPQTQSAQHQNAYPSAQTSGGYPGYGQYSAALGPSQPSSYSQESYNIPSNAVPLAPLTKGHQEKILRRARQDLIYGIRPE